MLPFVSEPAYRYFLLNLTFDHAAIYNPERWDNIKLAQKCSSSQRVEKEFLINKGSW
jgi:hypothetical protein